MSEAGKRIYEVQVAGLPLKLRSSHDAQTVDELIQFVDQKIKEAMTINSSASFQNALVLAALNIAEELLSTQRLAAGELGRIEERAKEILDRFEEAGPVPSA